MNKNLLIGVILVIALLVVILSGVFTHNKNDLNQDADSTSGQNTEDSISSDTSKDDQILEFTVEMSNFSFSPNKLEAKAGEVIHIQLVNKEGMHDFVIDELNVKSSIISTGGTEFLEFTIPEEAKGDTYEFYCSVGNHRELGMVGDLKVI